MIFYRRPDALPVGQRTKAKVLKDYVHSTEYDTPATTATYGEREWIPSRLTITSENGLVITISNLLTPPVFSQTMLEKNSEHPITQNTEFHDNYFHVKKNIKFTSHAREKRMTQ